VQGLEHANILRLLDSGEHEGVPYLVTEHAEGARLDSYCRKDSLLARSTAVELIAGVAEGLNHAHQAGVVHGDINPSNLVRVDERTVKIAGFGLRPGLAASEKHEFHGTPGYLSPEQIRHEPVDGRADLFSLGAVLYELLTGEKAFPGDSESAILYRSVNEEVRDPTQLEPPMHSEVADAVLRAVAKRPENRFATAAQFAEALYSAAVACRVDESIEPTASAADAETREMAVGALPEPESVPASRSPARSSAKPFVIGGLFLVLMVAGLLFVRHGTMDPTPPPAPWLEAVVRTEPSGVEVQLDGEPLDPAALGRIRFRGQEPFGVLTAFLECRTSEHRLVAADAGTELVIVIDPVEVEVAVDPGVSGAQVLLNGDSVGTTPTDVRLNLCRTNQLELQAPGYHRVEVEVPSGAGPLEARKLLYALALEKIPMGRLALPRRQGLELVYYVDGSRIGKSVREVELAAGRHELRLKNEYHWIDVRRQVSVEDGKTARPGVDVTLATLVVQAFPSNCKVYVRRPGGRWRYLDETPAKRRVATGDYEVKVQLNPTGETRVKKITLKASGNPPLRVAFGGAR
jgi:serine/threonine-protein kinase